MTRALSLARVSSAEQAKKSSPRIQFKRNREYAERAGLTIVAELFDDVSGTVPIRERPEWGKVYPMVEQGAIGAVIIYTHDRTARDEDVLEYLLFKAHLHKHGVELHYSDAGLDPYTMEGNLVGYIKAHSASSERLHIIERTSRGRVDRAEGGLYPTRAPSEYLIIRDVKGRSIGAAFVSDYRPVFDKLARLFLAGHQYKDIAARLGNRPTTGRPWTWQSIRYVLCNPFYRGRIEYGHRSVMVAPKFTVRGKHDSAWPEEICQRIEQELARRKELYRRVPKSDGLLSGLLFCDYCQRPLRIITSGYHKRTGQRYRIYGCGHYMDRRPEGHPFNSIREHKAVSQLQAAFAAITPERMGRLQVTPRLDTQSEALTQAALAGIQLQLIDLSRELDRLSTPGARSLLEKEIARLDTRHKEMSLDLVKAVAAEREVPLPPIEQLRTLAPDHWREALYGLRFPVRRGQILL